jgi:hypothetical protein
MRNAGDLPLLVSLVSLDWKLKREKPILLCHNSLELSRSVKLSEPSLGDGADSVWNVTDSHCSYQTLLDFLEEMFICFVHLEEFPKKLLFSSFHLYCLFHQEMVLDSSSCCFLKVPEFLN